MGLPSYQLLVIIPPFYHTRPFASLLERAGNASFLVTQVASAPAALAALSARPYDLIVVDIRLSAQAGTAFLVEKQSRGLTTPVFVFTSDAEEADAWWLGHELQQAIVSAKLWAHLARSPHGTPALPEGWQQQEEASHV